MARLGLFMLFRALCLTWLYVPFQWVLLRNQGLSATELLGLNGAFCGAAVLFEVPTGVLADWWGRRTLFIGGCLLSLLACLAFAAAFAGAQSNMLLLLGANGLAALSMCCIGGADSAYLFEHLQWIGRPDLYRRAEAWSSALRWTFGAVAAGGASVAVSVGLPLAGLYGLTGCLALTASLVAVSLTEPWRTSSTVPRAPIGSNGPLESWACKLSKARRASVAGLRERGGTQLSEANPRFYGVIQTDRRSRTAAPPGPASLVAALSQSGRVLVALRRRRDLWALALFSATLFPVLRMGLIVDAPFLLRLGLDPTHLGWVYGGKDILAALAAAGTATALARWGEYRVMVVLPLAAGIALAIMSLAESAAALVWLAVPTMGFGIFSPLVRTYVNRRIEENGERAALLSSEGMARRVGFALLSPLVGAVIDVWSLPAALALTALWTSTSFAVVVILLRPRRTEPADREGATGPPLTDGTTRPRKTGRKPAVAPSAGKETRTRAQ